MFGVVPHVAPVEEEEGPVSFLLPARRQVEVTVKTEEIKPVLAATGSRASRFMKSQEPEKPHKTDDKPDRTADKTALLAGILNGMKPTGSPMSTPSQTHAVAGAAQGQPLGMPMFFAAPPGIGSPSVGHAVEGGKNNDHMNRLLGMLKGDGGASPMASPVMAPPPMQMFAGDAQQRTFGGSTQPERTFSGPPGINTAPPSINTGPSGINTAPPGRQSRFFGGHSTTPSAVQSPVESPVQVKHRLGEGKLEDREEERTSPLHSLHASPQRPQQARDHRQGIETARSPVEHLVAPPGFPQATSPGVEMHNRPFALGGSMPPPMEMMASPMRGQSTLDDASRQPMFRGPPQHHMPPPPFWQGPAPPQGMPLGQGMMHSPQPGMAMPPPIGFMSPPHVYQQPPPGMMPPPFGAYASPIAGHGQPVMPFGIPPHVQQMPPHFQHGYSAPGQGMPPPHQQQSMTHDLMNLLGSMQSKN